MSTLTFPHEPGPYAPQQPAGNRQQPATTTATGLAISWGSVLAGAGTALALSLVLASVGAAMGLAALVSFWNAPTTPSQLTTNAVGAWLIFMQLAASAAGGYVTGFARERRGATPAREGVHGLLAWAVATIVAGTVMAGILIVLSAALPHAWTAQDQVVALTTVLWFLASLVAGAAISTGAAIVASWRSYAVAR